MKVIFIDGHLAGETMEVPDGQRVVVAPVPIPSDLGGLDIFAPGETVTYYIYGVCIMDAQVWVASTKTQSAMLASPEWRVFAVELSRQAQHRPVFSHA